jgi:cyclomaltodextrinase / maltogenic alpha-amylase / neopullulanase
LNSNNPLPPLPAEPRPGRYRHYKGGEYRVVGIARHSETLEALVIYEALYGEGGLWVRPAAMFTETIEFHGRRVPRFARVSD